VVQALQRMLHRGLVRPILDGRRTGPPKPLLALVRHVPVASYVTAYLVGVGIRPEHAPASAVRPVPVPTPPAGRRPTVGGLRRRLTGHRVG
jgi:hypothetical protein